MIGQIPALLPFPVVKNARGDAVSAAGLGRVAFPTDQPFDYLSLEFYAETSLNPHPKRLS